MKFLPSFFFLLLFAFGSNLCAQSGGPDWVTQGVGITGEVLYGASFINADTGIIGGDAIILHTTDGGANWTMYRYNSDTVFYAVSVTDAKTWTVVGNYAVILHTTNAGATWTKQASPYSGNPYTYNQFNAISYTDANNGTIVGQDSILHALIIHTTNGGAVWNAQAIGTTNILHGVSFVDANTGTAVGDSGTILRTTDGGAHWVTQASGTAEHLYAVSFADTNMGTAVGHGIILHTTDGGANWINQTGSVSGMFTGVSFFNANIGAIVGYNGTILHTSNGGTNWVSQQSTTTIDLNAISFAGAKSGTAVGNGGIILHTSDGGAATVSEKSGIPSQFTLRQNFPNPFSATTNIEYRIPNEEFVTLKVYNALGEEIATLASSEQSAGEHTVPFDASNLPNGFYFYKISAGKNIQMRSMVILK